MNYQIRFFDVFSFLVPGVFIIFGIGIPYWSAIFCLANQSVGLFVVLAISLSYVVGHIAFLIGDHVFPNRDVFGGEPEQQQAIPLYDTVLSDCRERAQPLNADERKRLYDLNPTYLTTAQRCTDSACFFRHCREYLSLDGNATYPESFQVMYGYSRTMVVCCLLVASACVGHLIAICSGNFLYSGPMCCAVAGLGLTVIIFFIHVCCCVRCAKRKASRVNESPAYDCYCKKMRFVVCRTIVPMLIVGTIAGVSLCCFKPSTRCVSSCCRNVSIILGVTILLTTLSAPLLFKNYVYLLNRYVQSVYRSYLILKETEKRREIIEPTKVYVVEKSDGKTDN